MDALRRMRFVRESSSVFCYGKSACRLDIMRHSRNFNGNSMRIATFNCNSIRVRLPAILAWLDEYSPDVLALQETKVVDRDFPLPDFTDRGWHVAHRGEKSYNGVAVVSKKPPEDVAFGLEDEEDGRDGGASETRLARIRVDGVTVVNTYVPQGQTLQSDKFAFKLRWFERLRAYFGALFKSGADRVVWLGDLNVAPLPIDVYDSKAVWPHVCHCTETIDAFNAVTAWGFVDVFRKHLPEPGTFTFWDYRQRGSLSRNRGWRIDHILASESLAARSVDCRVDVEPRKAERPSDHTFVFADFQ